jgi:CHAT domain-containing protein/Tfp pilus assembly protein PilF
MPLFAAFVLALSCSFAPGNSGFPKADSHFVCESQSTTIGPLQDKLADAGKLEKAGKYAEAEKLYRQVLAGAEKGPDRKLEADALHGLAVALLYERRPGEALPLVEREISLREHVGVDLDIAAALFLAGYVAQVTAEYPKALDFYTRDLAIREKLGNPRDMAASLNNIGAVYNSLGQFEKALDFDTRALALLEKLGNAKDIADSLNNIADAYGDLGQFDKALDFFNRALALTEKAGITQNVAMSLNNIGAVYDFLGQFDKALDFHFRGLALQEKLGNPHDVALSLNGIGIVYEDLGQFEKALDYHSRALALYEKLGNPQDIAMSLNNIGGVDILLGRFDKALDYLTRALALHAKIGNPKELADSLHNIGNVYYSIGQFDKALDFYTRALALVENLGNSQDVASTLNDIGSVNGDLGQFDKALEFLTRALALREKLGNTHDVANSLNGIGSVYYSLRQFDKALDFLTRALALKEKLGNPQELAYSLSGIGAVYDTLGKFDKALDFETRSLVVREKLGNPKDIALSLDNIGHAQERRGRLAAAAAVYSRGLKLYEDVSNQVGNPLELADFHESNQGDLEARFARLRLKQGEPKAALEMADHARGWALSRQVSFNATNPSGILSPADAASVKSATQKVAEANAALRVLLQRLDTASGAQIKELETRRDERKKDLSDAEQKYELKRDSLFARFPRLKEIAGDSPKSAARLIQLGQRNAGTLFLEYRQVDDELMVFAVDSKGLKTQVLSLKSKELQEAVHAFTTAIQSGKASEPAGAKKLYRMLLGPVLGARKLPKHLVIVPDGPLLEVPFAALMDGQGKRLIQDCSISTAVSLGILTWDDTPRHPTENLLVVADPMAEGATVTSPSRGASFGRLPGAQAEGKGIINFVPKSIALIGSDAREARIKEEAGKYAILHFATHGILDPKLPMRSALVLAPEDPTKNPTEDGFLQADEIVGLPLSAQLAVLSACHTGEGASKGEEGLMGLAWAFRAAGVPAIVASKWAVEDESTRRIMVRFYEELLKPGTRKDDALRTAMLAEMAVQEKLGKSRGGQLKAGAKATGRSNAFYWAAFQLVGDPSPLRPLPRK